jgi:hypothetical protein
MFSTDCTEAELAETRKWIVQVCMVRHIASGMSETEARVFVEAAMIAPFRPTVRTLERSETAYGR